MKTKKPTVTLGTYCKTLPRGEAAPTAAPQMIAIFKNKKRKNEGMQDRNSNHQGRITGLRGEMHA